MKKRLLIITISLLLVALAAGFYLYQRFMVNSAVPKNLPAESYVLHVPTNATFEQVKDSLRIKGIVTDMTLFEQLADYMKYKRDPMRAGRFELKPGSNMVDMIRLLRNGKQSPIDLVLTNERMIENVAAKAARFIEPDSVDFISLFYNDKYLEEIGYNRDELMTLFIPNTYEFFWNTDTEGFMKRMIKEHDRFWSQNNRLDKAKKLGLTPKEVYTLASIVEKETLRNDEKRRMAGVYYNRLEIGMLLQADPTSVFATRDFATKRVTDYHTTFDSPYNTYVYTGLPPGPIAMSSISSIDAVLSLEDHNYLYFCAKGDGSGYHNFARTLSQHNANAAIYRANLRKRGLR